jgi:hypothetical protein
MAQTIAAQHFSPHGQPIPEDVFERHNRSLRVIRLMFVELDEIVADGDEVSDAEWAGWAPTWSVEMHNLVELVQARDAGRLTLYQETLLGDILALLERERPRLAALRLASPPIPAPVAAR